MQKFKLDSMIKGWFVGDFSPCVCESKDFEVAVKYYKKGECEARHYHKIAREITCIAQGRVKMNGVELGSGEIVALEPCESTDFLALEDSITAVVKMPSVKNDKFLGEFVESSVDSKPHKDCHFERSEKSKKSKHSHTLARSPKCEEQSRDISLNAQYDNEKSTSKTNASAGILDEKLSQQKGANDAHLGVRRNEASLRRDDLSLKSQAVQASFRVIADHARSVAFLLAQGVNFDKEGRGYVLRRILRRAVRHGYLLGLKKPFLCEVVGAVCESMGGHYG